MSASPPYVPGPSTLSDPAAAPSATWNAQMPTLEQFGNDVGKWMAAVKEYAKIANGPNMFPASPTDAQMQAAYGPGWTAAGVNAPVSQGEYNSRLLKYEYLHQHQPGVKGPSIGLQLASREHVRPDEMQAAYNAVNPENGAPMLLPQIGGYLESTYGLKPTTQYQDPNNPAGGTAAATNPAGGTFFDPTSGQLVSMSTNPPPGSGYLEVPNSFDPNDPNAVHIRDAMGYINVMAKQGSIHGGDSQAEWNYIDSILKPLGIDPAVFVAGVLNYNGYDIAADGTLSQPGTAFAGSTPAGPGTTTPTGTLGAGGGAGGTGQPGSTPGGQFQMPGGTPTGTLGAGSGTSGTGGGPAAPGGGYQMPGGSPPPQPATQQPQPQPQPQPEPTPTPTQNDTSGPPAATNTPGSDQLATPGHAGWQAPHTMSMQSQPPLTTNQPGQVQAMSSMGLGPAPTAAQLAQMYGNTSTIDSRYPDWLLQHRPQQATRGQVTF